MDAKQFIKDHGLKDLDHMNEMFARKSRKRIVKGKPKGEPVKAFMENDRLIAKCECNGAEFVHPDDLRFFCHSCGNKSTGGRYRPVDMSEVK